MTVTISVPETTRTRPVRCCEKCGEKAGSRSLGTGRPLMRDNATGEFFHVNCRPGAVVGIGAALAGFEIR